MRTLFTLFVLVTFTVTVFPATYYVPDDYGTIQEAINSSVNGDTIIVKPGTYVENIDFIGKALTLTSEMGADATTIDGNQAGSVVICQSGVGPDTVLDGFTIINGWAPSGGGMRNVNSSPTVKNCTFIANYAKGGFGAGGGMFNWEGSPMVTDCTFTGNMADNYGGGIYSIDSSPTISGSIISQNTASYGGGIHCRGSSSLIIGNTVADNTADYSGGGIWFAEGDTSTVTKNIIFNNIVTETGNYWGGGGLCIVYYSTPIISNCILSGNSSAVAGGAITFGEGSNATITNNSIYGNMAEYGGGTYCFSSAPTITNTILWDNTAYTGPEICLIMGSTPSVLTISYSDVEGGQASTYVDPGCTLNWGMGMTVADPLFVDSASNDFHLTYNSPCRDAGDNSVAGTLDFEGDPRIAWGGTADMGADEFYTHLYITGDQTPGGGIQGMFVGLPGTSPVQLFIGLGDVRPTALPTAYGDLWLLPPRLSIPLVPIPANGILSIPTTIPLSPPAPYDIPMQGLVGLNSDSLTNLCVLEVR